MTLTEEDNLYNGMVDINLNRVIPEVIRGAQHDNRIVSGVIGSANYLKRSNPEDVTACIIPVDGDVTNSMYHSLLIAFCYEMHIALVRVDKCSKLLHLLTNGRSRSSRTIFNMEDCMALLILRPTNETVSETEHTFIKLMERAVQQQLELPVAQLQVSKRQSKVSKVK